jgi:hypothetical protein
VRRKSPFKAIGRAIRQQVNRLMAFQIDEESPVALALTPRPVINTDRLDAGYRHGWTQLDSAQYRVGAGLHAEPP